MNYEELKNVLLALIEEYAVNNPRYCNALIIMCDIVRKEEQYRRQVSMLMGERWVERYMNEDWSDRC